MTDEPVELDAAAALYASTVAACVDYRRVMRLDPTATMTATLPPGFHLDPAAMVWLTTRLAEQHITIDPS